MAFKISLANILTVLRFVFPKGFEPPSSEPESDILSIELRKQMAQIY